MKRTWNGGKVDNGVKYTREDIEMLERELEMQKAEKESGELPEDERRYLQLINELSEKSERFISSNDKFEVNYGKTIRRKLDMYIVTEDNEMDEQVMSHPRDIVDLGARLQRLENMYKLKADKEPRQSKAKSLSEAIRGL